MKLHIPLNLPVHNINNTQLFILSEVIFALEFNSLPQFIQNRKKNQPFRNHVQKINDIYYCDIRYLLLLCTEKKDIHFSVCNEVSNQDNNFIDVGGIDLNDTLLVNNEEHMVDETIIPQAATSLDVEIILDEVTNPQFANIDSHIEPPQTIEPHQATTNVDNFDFNDLDFGIPNNDDDDDDFLSQLITEEMFLSEVTFEKHNFLKNSSSEQSTISSSNNNTQSNFPQSYYPTGFGSSIIPPDMNGIPPPNSNIVLMPPGMSDILPPSSNFFSPIGQINSNYYQQLTIDGNQIPPNNYLNQQTTTPLINNSHNNENILQTANQQNITPTTQMTNNCSSNIQKKRNNNNAAKRTEPPIKTRKIHFHNETLKFLPPNNQPTIVKETQRNKNQSTNDPTTSNSQPSTIEKLKNKTRLFSGNTINLTELMYCCKKCLSDSIEEYEYEGKVCGRPKDCIQMENVKRYIEKKTHRNMKKRGADISKIFEKILDHNGHSLKGFYLLEMSDDRKLEMIIEALMEYIKIKKTIPKYLQNFLRLLLKIDIVKMMFVTDKLMISGRTYLEFFKHLNLHTYFPPKYKLMETKRTYNAKCKELFKITVDKNCVRMSLRDLIKQIIILNEFIEEEIEETSSKPKRFQFKLCCDGRRLVANQIALAVVPMNMDSFATQEVLSVFYLALVQLDETKENVKEYLSNYYEKDIIDLEKNGITIDDVKYEIDFVYCSDLKNVSAVTEKKCICCQNNLQTDIYSIANPWPTTTKNSFGIALHNHVICILHLKQRIQERLLSYIANVLTEKEFNVFTENIRKIAKCGSFSWREKTNVPDYDNQDIDDQRITDQPNQIKGYQVDLMLLNIPTIFENINIEITEKDKYIKLLSLWRDLLCFIQATNSDIENYGKELFLTALQRKVVMFHLALKAVFPNRVVKSQYIHLLNHLPDLIRRFGSFTRYSNQGFENSHKYHRTLFTRLSNNGGSGTSIMEFILLWQSRKMLACRKCDSCWGDLKLRKHKPNSNYDNPATLTFSKYLNVFGVGTL